MGAASQDLIISRRDIHLLNQASFPVAAATKIYQGTFAGRNGDVCRPLVAGDDFLGLVPQQVDNSAGAAGDLAARLETGIQIKRAVVGADSAGKRGRLVYATNDNELTLTAAGNSLIGAVEEWLTGTTCWIHVFTAAELAAAL